MYLKCSKRCKNGKEHRSWSIVENRRVHGGQSVQRHVLYLGEINDSQQAAWQKSIAVFTEGESEPRQMALFPELVTFQFRLDRARLRQMYRREGRYLLRSNLTESDPATLWQHYITLTQIEEAFKNLKGDLGVRPIFHQKDERIEAHILVAFQAYCLHVTLNRRLHALAPGLTARAVLEKFASLSLLDVQLPTTDGRTLLLTRHTQPDQDTQLLLAKLKLQLPPQPPPRITAPEAKTVS